MTDNKGLWSAADAGQSSPIILLGRGGGGTRLLSEFVTSLDVFMGNDLNVSFDSVEWVKTIYDLSMSHWNGAQEDEAAEIERLRATAAQVLNAGGKAKSDAWGWKLPETTLIAPLICRAFPNARIVHLVRHPVTTCCRRSHMTSRPGTPMGMAALSAAYRYIGRDIESMGNDPTHIRNAASWAFQVDIVLKTFAAAHLALRPLTVTYEDICTNSEPTAQKISDYLGLSSSRQDTPFSVDANRVSAVAIDSDEAAEVWDICKSEAAQLGYTETVTK
ncbi:MAG: sulfotransferase [Sulfitobacter sp.]